MEELTLKEIAEFRILSSTFPIENENKIPEYIKELIKSEDGKRVNKKLIENIFKKLRFTYGGAIWIIAEFIIESSRLTIKIGKHELATYSISEKADADESGNHFTHPLKIDTLLYKYFPGPRKLELSTDISGPLINYSYKRNGKKRHTSAPGEFNRRFHGKVFIDAEKYYKCMEMLNLPITHNMGILEKIAEEALNDPLSRIEDINRIHLTELARFFHSNSLYKDADSKPKIINFFTIYKPVNFQSIEIKNAELNRYAKLCSEYYEIDLDNKSFSSTLQRLEDVCTPRNLSTLSTKALKHIPLFALIASFFVFLNLYKVSGGFNFSSSLFITLREEMFVRIAFDASLFTILSLETLASFKLFGRPYALGILNHWNIRPWMRSIIIGIAIFLSVSAFIKLFRSNSLELVIASVSLIPIIFYLFITLATRYLSFYISNRFAAILLTFLVLIPLYNDYSNPNSMKGQSCIYDESNQYRYFETDNWAEKIEIAILPGSSEEWINDRNSQHPTKIKLQLPTKITVQKSDLQTMKSCTDEFTSWDEFQEWKENKKQKENS